MAEEESASTSNSSLNNVARLAFVANTVIRKLLQKTVVFELAGKKAGATTLGNAYHEEKKRLSKEPMSELLKDHVNKNSHLYRLLTPDERNFISDDAVDDFDFEFDIHLLYKILRYLELTLRPTRGWGDDIPPMWNEHTIGDDVERIRGLWNDIVYRSNTGVSDDDLDKYFCMFDDIAIMFENYFDKPYGKFKKMVKEAKEKIIDQETENEIISEMKDLAIREAQYGSIDRYIFVPKYTGDVKMYEFFRKVILKPAYHNSTYVRRIPEDVQEHINEQIQKWKTADKLCVLTTSSHHVVDAVKKNNFVTVTGCPGSGKTFLARHAALELRKELVHYEIIPIENLTELIDFYEPGKYIVFVIDDIGGKFAANSQLIEQWQQILPAIQAIAFDNNCKVIATCRSNIYNDEKFELLSPFKSYELNVSADKFKLCRLEKQMFINVFELTNIDVDILPDKCDYFPLIFSLCKSLQEDGKVFGNPIDVFCNDPWSVMKNELDNMFRRITEEEFKLKICSLFLCILLNNKLKESWFTQGSKITSYQRDTLEEAFKWCGLHMETSKLDVKDALGKLEGTFVVKECGEYRIIHNKVFDCLAHYFPQKIGQCLIRNGNWHLIHERLVWRHSQASSVSSIEFMIQVPDDDLCRDYYISRLAIDMSTSRGGLTIGNPNMKDLAFRKNVLIDYLGKMSLSQRIALAKEKSASGTSLLALACQHGYPEIVQWLLNYGAPVDLCTFDGNSPLHFAAKIGNMEILMSLLEKGPNVNIQNNKGLTPLFLASENSHIEIVAALLSKGADVNLSEFEGETPLSIACYKQYTEIALMLLKHNINVNQSIITGDTALHTVCENNNETLISALLEKDPDMTLLNANGEIPLTVLVENGTPSGVAMLLKKDFDVDTASWLSDSALIKACKLRQDDKLSPVEKVRMLLEKGSDVNQMGGNGKTPLILACESDSADIVRLLLDAECDVDVCNKFGESPLCIACEHGNAEIVKMLLDKNADVNLCDDDSPLTIASQRGHSDIVSMLMKVDTDIDWVDKDGCTPLILACQSSNFEIVVELLERGADPNQRDNDGTSPLYWACCQGDLDIGQKLLENGANVNLPDNDGLTPLHAACHEKHSNLVRLLIEHKCNVNVEMYDGDRPIFSAAWAGSAEIVDLLLTNEANTNMFLKSKNAIKAALKNHASKSIGGIQRDWYDDLMEKGSTSVKLYMEKKSPDFLLEVITGSHPMHIACFMGHTEVVNCLISHNVDVNIQKKDGTTPLIYACEVGHEDIVKLLLKKGADTALTRTKGKSPIDVATDNGHDAIMEMLCGKI